MWEMVSDILQRSFSLAVFVFLTKVIYEVCVSFTYYVCIYEEVLLSTNFFTPKENYS